MNQTKLLFIDSKVDNYNQLISQIDPQTRVVILKPNQNGIDQISKSLDESCDVETVHIVSHGAKGTLYLGDSILNSENIHLYTENIQKWGKCLSADGEILIYGCQVASGQEGKEFVRQLHQLTGANIAASETLSGNVNKGGNWNLEVIFGQLKSALAFTPEVRASYAGVLADIVVNTTNDVVDDSDGVTSLREAIIQANSTPEDDTIQLTAGETYNLTISGGEEDAAATGDLDIVGGGGEITVISEGEEKATIDAGGETGISDRVFHVLDNAALQLENVEVTGGSVADFHGGGIYNEGTVNITNSTITGNSASYGGGIDNSGVANINNSTITGNYGITIQFSYPPSGDSINESTITGNSPDDSDDIITISKVVTTGYSASCGGGIYNSGSVSIYNSIISGNEADVGGGIFNKNRVSITNSTITGNSAVELEGDIPPYRISGGFGFGGGIYNEGTASISISNSTISGNSGSYGSGIYNHGTANISESTIGDGGIGNSGTIDINNSNISSIGNSGTTDINNSNISSIGNSGTTDINNSNISGGGIGNSSSGTVSINYSMISGNSRDVGAGINNSGTAIINYSTISGNSANRGGGIYNDGTVSINNSTISGNSAKYFGGGIFNDGTANINSTTISSNSANRGGGIYNNGASSININNSTISSNSGDFGGGIYNLGRARISNSTITINETVFNHGSGILHRDYGGYFSYGYQFRATTIVTSSIVSGNFNSDVDFTGNNDNLISGNHNLIGTGNAINNFNRDNDQTGVTNPLLGGLADNGGSTLTHLPLPNSPAIDAGSNLTALTTDQRGQPRLAGEAVDIGAVELQPIQEIIGTPSSDILNGTSRQDRIFGLTGNDVISGLDSSDILFGNEDNDTLNGDAGNDVALGGKDNDLIDGGLGNDSISGDFGDDTLIGGEGIDTLTGGDDADIFQLAVGEGLDIITDFVPQQDIILLDKNKNTFTAITSDSGTGFSVNGEFAIVTSDADAETSAAIIVYNSNNGKLFYNVNGTEAEFSSGGEFANLSNIASISEDDFFLRG